jgi:hypothetical protein
MKPHPHLKLVISKPADWQPGHLPCQENKLISDVSQVAAPAHFIMRLSLLELMFLTGLMIFAVKVVIEFMH